MFLKKILILFISCGCLELSSACADINPSISHQCLDIFNGFHSCASKFLEVSMEHANPFTVCTNESSYRKYFNMKEYFNLLATTNDPKNKSIICSDEYLNKNQQTVILTILNTANEIWESANCDDCYTSTSVKNQTFSDHTIELQKMHANYSNCTEMSKDICQNCQHIYLELNADFDHQKKKNGGTICFDLEDIMNKTRQEWSGIYKCCKDKKDSLTAFFSMFSTVMVIAVVFYGGVYVSGSRYPEVDLLDAQQISTISTVTSTLRSAPEPSSSSSSSIQRPSRFKNSKQKPKTTLLINEDSEDDEPIIKPTPVNTNLVQLDE